MMDYLRRNNVRAILDLSFHKKLPILLHNIKIPSKDGFENKIEVN